MKVLLVHFDGKMPNLALMKWSTYHKKKGNTIYFNQSCKPDKVYLSCIFEKNRAEALGEASLWKLFGADVEVGGSGIDLTTTLPKEVEHLMPDYYLYGIEYSMGFSSRGCIRNCPWCVVPKKEGSIREHASIDEFYVPRWKKLILFDNNFLASPKWHEKLREIIARKIKINFNQGLDIRLVDQEVAELLSKCHYYNWKFTKRSLYFAFDFPQVEDALVNGIEKLIKANVKARNIMVYVLTGFNTTMEENKYRVDLLVKLGVKPYVMLYNDRKDRPIERHFERWVNRNFYQFIPWEKYLKK